MRRPSPPISSPAVIVTKGCCPGSLAYDCRHDRYLRSSSFPWNNCAGEDITQATSKTHAHVSQWQLSCKNGSFLILVGYNAAGKVAVRRTLDVRVAKMWPGVTCPRLVMGYGYTAVESYEDAHNQPLLYLLNDKGKLVGTFPAGYKPQFTDDGKYLFYITTTRKPGGREAIGPMVVHVYDLRERRECRRLVTEPGIPEPPSDYWVCPNAGCIVFACQTGFLKRSALMDMYLADIRKPQTKWHKLPIRAFPAQWTVLDHVPSSFVPCAAPE